MLAGPPIAGLGERDSSTPADITNSCLLFYVMLTVLAVAASTCGEGWSRLRETPRAGPRCTAARSTAHARGAARPQPASRIGGIQGYTSGSKLPVKVKWQEQRHRRQLGAASRGAWRSRPIPQAIPAQPPPGLRSTHEEVEVIAVPHKLVATAWAVDMAI